MLLYSYIDGGGMKEEKKISVRFMFTGNTSSPRFNPGF
jgi:hypothetical protein